MSIQNIIAPFQDVLKAGKEVNIWSITTYSLLKSAPYIILARQGVLVSAGTELTFFLVAGTVLCFGFSVRMMLITL